MTAGSDVLFDVDSQSNQEILARLIRTLGKSKEQLEEEAFASQKKDNPAYFGKDYERYCLCSVAGQVPCSELVPVPKHWRGKYARGQAMDDD